MLGVRAGHPRRSSRRVLIRGEMSAAAAALFQGKLAQISGLVSSRGYTKYRCNVLAQVTAGALYSPRVLISGTVTAGTVSDAIATFPNGYKYRRRIVLKASSNKAGFALGNLVWRYSAQEVYYQSVAEGGQVESDLGWDIRFELADGTKLDHDLDAYSDQSGLVECWVKQPTLPHDADTPVFVYHGKSGLLAPEANPAGVFSGYLTAWDCVTGVDKTGQARHLTPSGISSDEMIGEAGSYVAGTSTMESPAAPGYAAGIPQLTIECWIKPATPPPPDEPPPVGLADALFLNPHNAASPQHRPIGTGATYASTQEDFSKATNVGFNTDNGGGTNVYKVTSSDPFRTVTADGSVGGNTGLPVTVRVPSNAIIGGTVSDRTIVFYDPATFLCHQFYHWNNPGSGGDLVNPKAGRYVVWDIRGDGYNVGTSAGKKSAFTSLIRGHELAAVGVPIRHSLDFSLNRFGSTSILSKNWIWPAAGRDGNAGDADKNLGNIDYGSVFGVLPQANGGPSKASLNLTELGGRLYDQLLNYGAIAWDGTSSTQAVTRGDQHCVPFHSEVRTELNKIRPHLRRITNTAQNQTCWGGGTPRDIDNALV